MLLSEEELCKLIKCSVMVGGQAEVISILASDTQVLNNDKGRKAIELLTKFSEEVEELLA